MLGGWGGGLQIFSVVNHTSSYKMEKTVDIVDTIYRKITVQAVLDSIYILLDVLLCSIAEYFYKLCSILTSL